MPVPIIASTIQPARVHCIEVGAVKDLARPHLQSQLWIVWMAIAVIALQKAP